jgi:uncharacterized membrane protein (UPF0127 family)
MIKKILSISVLLCGCVSSDLNADPLCSGGVVEGVVAGKHLNIEMACTNSEKERGLMYRKIIPDNYGMLFVFDHEQILAFWMKNTYAPLSIAYLDKNYKIQEMFDMKPLSQESIFSSGNVKYALEVKSGWFRENQVKVGDKVDFIVK